MQTCTTHSAKNRHFEIIVEFAILDIPLTRTSNAYKVWQHQLTPAARNSRMEFVQNALLVIISIELRSVNLFPPTCSNFDATN